MMLNYHWLFSLYKHGVRSNKQASAKTSVRLALRWGLGGAEGPLIRIVGGGPCGQQHRKASECEISIPPSPSSPFFDKDCETAGERRNKLTSPIRMGLFEV